MQLDKVDDEQQEEVEDHYVIIGETGARLSRGVTRRRFVFDFGGGELGVVSDGANHKHQSSKWKHKNTELMVATMEAFKRTTSPDALFYCCGENHKGPRLIAKKQFHFDRTRCKKCLGYHQVDPNAVYVIRGEAPPIRIGAKNRYAVEWEPGLIGVVSEGTKKCHSANNTPRNPEALARAIAVWKKNNPHEPTHYFCVGADHIGERNTPVDQFGVDARCYPCKSTYHAKRIAPKLRRTKREAARDRKDSDSRASKKKKKKKKKSNKKRSSKSKDVEEEEKEEEEPSTRGSSADVVVPVDKQRVILERLLQYKVSDALDKLAGMTEISHVNAGADVDADDSVGVDAEPPAKKVRLEEPEIEVIDVILDEDSD